ncbi:hypothetical protein Dsin_025344, partial [Dipteronia sinensis]
MNSEEIAMLCANMTLSEKDGLVQKLQTDLRAAGEQRMGLSLVGKVLTSKMVNREAFLGLIGRIWRVDEGLDIEMVRQNVFIFQFHDTEDRRRVLECGTWTFDGALIILEKPTGKDSIENMRFNMAEFWVQIHQVPIVCMTKEIGLFLGGLVGEVMDVDVGNSGDGKETVMIIRYEHLPNHCFRCSRLGHSTQECSETLEAMRIGGREELPFGAWMRATGHEKLGGYRRRRGNAYKPLSVCGGPGNQVGSTTSSRSGGDWRRDRSFSYKPGNDELMMKHKGGLNASGVVNRDINVRHLEKRNVGTRVTGEVIGKDFVFKSQRLVTTEGGEALSRGGEPYHNSEVRNEPNNKGKENMGGGLDKPNIMVEGSVGDNGCLTCRGCVFGDFNEILSMEEKEGGVLRQRRMMEKFREAIDFYQLDDLGFSGPGFTWSNRRGGRSMIQERLDRVLRTLSWHELFPNSLVSHLGFWGSDHRAILLGVLSGSNQNLQCAVRSRRRFHFEACWADREECLELVNWSWVNSYGVGVVSRVVAAISSCRNNLSKWNLRNRKVWRDCIMELNAFDGLISVVLLATVQHHTTFRWTRTIDSSLSLSALSLQEFNFHVHENSTLLYEVFFFTWVLTFKFFRG